MSFKVAPVNVHAMREAGFSATYSGTPAPAGAPGLGSERVTLGQSVELEPGCSVFVGLAEVPERGWVGKVEGNPARHLDPGGCSLAPAEVVLDVLGEMFSTAEGLGVQIRTDPQDARVKRLDVARDFRGVGIPSFYVRGLQNIKRTHARSSYTYNNPQRNAAETLWVGSKTGGARLYDQWEAYGDKGAPQGSLRFEVEARGGWLDKVGIRSVGDVSASAVERLALTRWEWSKMGTRVEGAASVVDAVERMICRHPRGARGLRDCGCDGLTRARADRLLGQLVRESLGVSATLSKSSASEYNKLKDLLGVVPSAELLSSACSVSVAGRLDYASGLEVAA